MGWQGQLGSQIKAARSAKGLSLRALATRIDISPEMLRRYEAGKPAPPLEVITAICSELEKTFAVNGFLISVQAKPEKAAQPMAAQQVELELGTDYRVVAQLSSRRQPQRIMLRTSKLA